MSVAPTFLTHHEIEGFLGGGQRGQRQRQRLQQREQLSQPVWLPRIDRLRVGIYPAFALAGLLDALAGAPDAGRRVRRLSEQVLTAAAFGDLNEALEASVRDVLRGGGQWRFDTVVQHLAEIAEPVVLEWDAVVREAVEALIPWGVHLSSELGWVERRAGKVYVVSLGDGRTERFSLERVAVPEIRKGSVVAVAHVTAMGDGLDIVLPALKGAETEVEVADLWADVTERDWDDALAAPAARAADFSFSASYWSDDAPAAGRAPAFRVPPSALSGREAAARLLAKRAKA